MRAGWDRYVINRRGHSATFDLSLSEPQQTGSATYRIPVATHPATRRWLLSAGLQREDIDGAVAVQQNLRVARERERGVGRVDTAFVRYQRDRGVPGDADQTFQAVTFGVETRDRRDWFQYANTYGV